MPTTDKVGAAIAAGSPVDAGSIPSASSAGSSAGSPANRDGTTPEGANARRSRDIAERALVVILVGALIAAAAACIVAVTVFDMSPLLLIAGVLLALLAFVVVLAQVYVSLQSKSPLEVRNVGLPGEGAKVPLHGPVTPYAILDPQLDPNQGVWILENGILKHDGKEVQADLYTLKYGDPEPSERALAFAFKGKNTGVFHFILKELLQCDSSRHELKFEPGSKGGRHLCYVTVKDGASRGGYLSALVCEAMMGRPDALRAYVKMQMRDCGSEIEKAAGTGGVSSTSEELRCFLSDCNHVRFSSVLSHLHLNEEETNFLRKATQLAEKAEVREVLNALDKAVLQDYSRCYWASCCVENDAIEKAKFSDLSDLFADGRRRCGALLVPSETEEGAQDLVFGCTIANFAAVGRKYCAEAKEDRPSPSPTIKVENVKEGEGHTAAGGGAPSVAT